MVVFISNHIYRYSRRYIITSVLITLLVILIIATVLPVLLIKSTTKTIISSNLDNTSVLRWNSNGITTAGISGSPGSANNQLNLPHDIVFDYANNLYIADRYNHRIQKYLFGSSIGQTVAGNVTSGFSLDKFSGPTRVLMDSNENLYIADTGNARIQFWRKGANSGTRIGGAGKQNKQNNVVFPSYNSLSLGYAGNSSNELYWPHGIALHPTSNILYIVDTTNHRIMSYTLGNNSGTLVFGFNGAGNSNTQLSWPIGLHFDILTNSLVISNHGANKIVRHVLGSSFWTLIAGDTNGVFGTTPAKFNGPIEAAFDPMGNLYVADRNNHRIQFFYAGQLNATTIAGITGVNDTNATTLHAPWSLRLDSQLNLYVSDTSNHRIQKFLRY